MDINAEIALNEALGELSRVNRDLILERTLRKQLQAEVSKLKQEIDALQNGQKKEKDE